jgi:hypothetical protein
MIYTQSLLALRPACAARGVGLVLDLGGGEALIGRARAGMLVRFLASPATHLLFVDADVGFAPEAVFRLLASGRDVIGGVYPRKGLDLTALREAVAAGDPDAMSRAIRPQFEPLAADGAAADDSLIAAASVGTGFLMVTRHAAQRMTEGYPQLRARLGDVNGANVSEAVMVFDSFVEPETRRYLADFEAFCRRWRDLGGEVWADPGCQVSHLSEVTLTV